MSAYSSYDIFWSSHISIRDLTSSSLHIWSWAISPGYHATRMFVVVFTQNALSCSSLPAFGSFEAVLDLHIQTYQSSLLWIRFRQIGVWLPTHTSQNTPCYLWKGTRACLKGTKQGECECTQTQQCRTEGPIRPICCPCLALMPRSGQEH